MIISFCIPTFNRKEYLKATIFSIIKEIESSNNIDKVEICISDNNSIDGTEEMINEIASNTKIKILFSKNDFNVGFDKNILKVVGLSTAKYIWLFGSDDHLIEGSLNKMLYHIEKNESDIYLCNRIECNLDLQPIKYDFACKSLKTNFSSSIESDLVEYFNSCTGLLGGFSFISALVFKNEIWSKQNFNDKYNGFVYSHVYMILAMIVKSKSNISLIKEHYIFCRQNDDIIRNEGLVKRILLDVNAYSEFAKYFFINNKKIYEAFVSVVRKEHEIVKFIFVKKNVSKEQWEENILPRLKGLNYSSFTLYMINNSELGSFFVRCLFFIKRKLKF